MVSDEIDTLVQSTFFNILFIYLGLIAAATAFEVKPELLEKALTERTVRDNSRGGKNVATPVNKDQATFTRDALAKATYDRLFSWIVKKVNENIYSRESGKKAIIGVLDIYGFEILEVSELEVFPFFLPSFLHLVSQLILSQTNSFEQFCINYCNEKLQQVFIELTLKAEQEEYEKEGIKWTPIDYFNNAIICKLIDEVNFFF
jgi:myosin-1